MANQNSETACYICGWNKDIHIDDDLHTFISEVEAVRELKKLDKYVESKSTPEQRYVEQHRPY